MIITSNLIFISNTFEISYVNSFFEDNFENDSYKVIFIPKNENQLKFVEYILNSNDESYSCKRYVILTSNKDIFKKAFPNNIITCNNDDFLINDKKNNLRKQINWIFDMNNSKNDNLFIIGDLHFGHANIIKYCDRPWNSGKNENGELIVSDNDVESMNNALINNWNSVVGINDTVIVNGDFALGNKNKIQEYVSKLNGHKKLVLGNHDRFHLNAEMKSKYKDIVNFYINIGFERVYDTPIILDDFIIISHEPVQWIRSKDVYANIYAHVHNQEFYKDYTCNTFCTSVERINYTPIKLSKIIETWKSFK